MTRTGDTLKPTDDPDSDPDKHPRQGSQEGQGGAMGDTDDHRHPPGRKRGKRHDRG